MTKKILTWGIAGGFVLFFWGFVDHDAPARGNRRLPHPSRRRPARVHEPAARARDLLLPEARHHRGRRGDGEVGRQGGKRTERPHRAPAPGGNGNDPAPAPERAREQHRLRDHRRFPRRAARPHGLRPQGRLRHACSACWPGCPWSIPSGTGTASRWPTPWGRSWTRAWASPCWACSWPGPSRTEAYFFARRSRISLR